MMTKSIKMIGLDLDGTLLTSEKVLTAHTKEVLKEAIEQGVVVLPATGRPFSGIPEEVTHFPGIRYALTANGARVIDIQENRIVYESLVPYETAKRLLDIIGKYEAILEIYYDGVGYTSECMSDRIGEFIPDLPMAEYVKSTRKTVPDVQAFFEENHRSSDKVQGIFLNQEDKKKAREEILRELPELEVTESFLNNIEVNAAGVSKGKSLVNLGKLLGITREEIMACGDGTNDMNMLQEVGLGVAMANAVDEVKRAADVITASNDEEGVAEAIEKYVLNIVEK